MPILGAEGAPVDPVKARTAMNAIANECRPATEPQIIGDDPVARHLTSLTFVRTVRITGISYPFCAPRR